MTELLASAQMRAMEQAAIDSGAVTGLELMERAGRGVVEAVFEEWPELAATAHRAVVLCGPGNNGGDGFVVARLLEERGWEVFVVLFGEPERLPSDAHANYRRWAATGVVLPWRRDTLEHIALSLDADRPTLFVDALFGIGLNRPLPPEITGPWDDFCTLASNLSSIGDAYAVAVDVPSGVSEAEPEGERLCWFSDDLPRLTVTFHALKAAHSAMLARGERISVKEIGL